MHGCGSTELRPDLPDGEVEALSLRKEALFRELAAESTAPVEGIEEFLRLLEDASIPKCIVTNAPRYNPQSAAAYCKRQ